MQEQKKKELEELNAMLAEMGVAPKESDPETAGTATAGKKKKKRDKAAVKESNATNGNGVAPAEQPKAEEPTSEQPQQEPIEVLLITVCFHCFMLPAPMMWFFLVQSDVWHAVTRMIIVLQVAVASAKLTRVLLLSPEVFPRSVVLVLVFSLVHCQWGHIPHGCCCCCSLHSNCHHCHITTHSPRAWCTCSSQTVCCLGSQRLYACGAKAASNRMRVTICVSVGVFF